MVAKHLLEGRLILSDLSVQYHEWASLFPLDLPILDQLHGSGIPKEVIITI